MVISSLGQNIILKKFGVKTNNGDVADSELLDREITSLDQLGLDEHL